MGAWVAIIAYLALGVIIMAMMGKDLNNGGKNMGWFLAAAGAHHLLRNPRTDHGPTLDQQSPLRVTGHQIGLRAP